jgi:hypothetical protein
MKAKRLKGSRIRPYQRHRSEFTDTRTNAFDRSFPNNAKKLPSLPRSDGATCDGVAAPVKHIDNKLL